LGYDYPQLAADIITNLPDDATPADARRALQNLDPLAQTAALATTTTSTGGGGTSGLINTTIEIPHAQILTLYSAGFTLVEPTETLDYTGLPTEIPVLIACTVIGISGGGAVYENAEGRHLVIMLSTGQDFYLGRSVRATRYQYMLADHIDSDYVGDARYDIQSLDQVMALPGAGQSMLSQFVFVETGTSNLSGSLQDNGLSLTIAPGGGNLTGGDPTNKLIVNLTYTVVTL